MLSLCLSERRSVRFTGFREGSPECEDTTQHDVCSLILLGKFACVEGAEQQKKLILVDITFEGVMLVARKKGGDSMSNHCICEVAEA